MDALPHALETTHRADRRATEPGLRQLVVLACAASAGLHAALVPTHAGESDTTAVLFAVSTVLLVAVALAVERGGRRLAVGAGALVLIALLALYGASRVATVWPLDHSEPVDAIGAVTKLFEVVGLVASLRLLQIPRAAAKELPALEEGVDR